MIMPRRGRHGRGHTRTLVLIALIAAIVGGFTTAAVVIAGRSGGSGAAGRGEVGRVGGGAPASWPSWGLTHTQFTPDSPAGLSSLPVPQNQSLMGWGADNPEPSPGQFNFGSLDRRVQLIRATRGVPIITLCGAPDWMKGGAPGQTDWSRLEAAPTPAHFDDFARLAAEVARRYPDVKYFVVWNEFKGFFSQGKNRWDYEGYTDFYNKVYTALKQVNPDIQVGGPYTPMSSDQPGAATASSVSGPWGSVDQRSLDAVSYWLAHKKGADFLAVDGSSMPDQPGARLDEFAAVAKFAAVDDWLRARSDLPIWWAEWYVEPSGAGWTDEHRGAVQAAAMMEFVESGAATALYWSPQTQGPADCPGCLWFGSGQGGGQTPTLGMLQNFSRWFPPGTTLVRVTSTNPAVRVLAQRKRLLAVNTSGDPVTTTVNGTRLALGGYEVRWVAW